MTPQEKTSIKLYPGQRVKTTGSESILGEGYVSKIVTNYYGEPIGCLVAFDNDPPIKYNGGENPCFVFLDALEVKQELNQ